MTSIQSMHGISPMRRPTILLGTGASRMGRLNVTCGEASQVDLHGLDLDLRTSWRAPSSEDIRESQNARIRSVWLPMQYSGPFCEQRVDQLRAFLNYCASRCGLRTIILPKNTPPRRQGIPLGPMAQQIAEWYGVRTAIGITADTMLENTGSHLQRIANMRRIAEEWDLDIALDLTTPDIEHWEAEAALMRLFPRLRVVRMRPLGPIGITDGTGSTRRAAARTLSMLADQAYHEIITIAPAPSQWYRIHRGDHQNLAAASATRCEILSTYDRVHQYLGQDRRSSRQS